MERLVPATGDLMGSGPRRRKVKRIAEMDQAQCDRIGFRFLEDGQLLGEGGLMFTEGLTFNPEEIQQLTVGIAC